MNNFNKIFGSLLLTVIIIFGINKASDLIYRVDAPTTGSYKVEAKNNTQTDEKKESKRIRDFKLTSKIFMQ